MRHGAGREVKEKGSPFVDHAERVLSGKLGKVQWTKRSDANAFSGATGRMIKKN